MNLFNMKKKEDIKKRVFVISKCGEPYDINNDIIRKITGILNIECVIAEFKFSFDEKSLLEDIYKDIEKADFVLIDLIPSNFNIAFEAGITYVVSRIKKNKANFYFLTPKYLFDLDRIPTDIKGLKHLTYKNYKEYAKSIVSCLGIKTNRDIKSELDNFINKLYIKNSENFIDYNLLSEKFVFNDARINLTPEGMQISYAHFPVYFRNFEFFSNYELIIKARIDERRFGIALHIESDTNKNINLLSLPLPLKFFMFNISEEGELLPHVFSRDIIHKRAHYWPFKNAIKRFKDIRKKEFFILNVRVNRNIIRISINNNECHSFDIKKLDIDELNYTDCLDSSMAKDKNLFQKHMKNLLENLNMGSFGFRVHPHEMATIRSIKYIFY